MDEVLRPADDALAALATQMGLPVSAPAKETKPAPDPKKAPAASPGQKSYSQLT